MQHTVKSRQQSFRLILQEITAVGIAKDGDHVLPHPKPTTWLICVTAPIAAIKWLWRKRHGMKIETAKAASRIVSSLKLLPRHLRSGLCSWSLFFRGISVYVSSGPSSRKSNLAKQLVFATKAIFQSLPVDGRISTLAVF